MASRESPPPSPSPSITLADLPSDIILDHLLPLLPYRTISNLSLSCRALYILTQDDTLWRGKIRRDFKLDVHSMRLLERELDAGAIEAKGVADAQQPVDEVEAASIPPSIKSGKARMLWMGLKRPRVYVWGSSSGGRLGLPIRSPHLSYHRSFSCVPYPVEITSSFTRLSSSVSNAPKIPYPTSTLTSTSVLSSPSSSIDEDGDIDPSHPGIIELRSGGFGFSARDSTGGVWLWGQLDGIQMGGLGNSANPYYMMRTPHRLRLPCVANAISMGRRHLVVLDEDNLIWEIKAVARAFYHTSSLLTSPSNPGSSNSNRPAHITQVSAGWNLSLALSSNGQIYCWWPFHSSYSSHCTSAEELSGPIRRDEEDGSEAESTAIGEDGEVAVKWGQVDEVVFKLPALPDKAGDRHGNQHEGEDQSQGFGINGQEQWEGRDEIVNIGNGNDPYKVVQVAAGSSCALALRANGEVWLLPMVEFDRTGNAEWQYLPSMSTPENRHISASYRTITAYSSHQALLATLPENFALSSTPTSAAHSTFERVLVNAERIDPPSAPFVPFSESTTTDGGTDQGDVEPSFHKIESGDYHKVAIDTAGTCYTWGTNDGGQLGLGDIQDPKLESCSSPQRVVFGIGDEENQIPSSTMNPAPHTQYSVASKPGTLGATATPSRDTNSHHHFVFDICANGWQSGALVVRFPRSRIQSKSRTSDTETNASKGTATNPDGGEEGEGPCGVGSGLRHGGASAPSSDSTTTPTVTPTRTWLPRWGSTSTRTQTGNNTQRSEVLTNEPPVGNSTTDDVARNVNSDNDDDSNGDGDGDAKDNRDDQEIEPVPPGRRLARGGTRGFDPRMIRIGFAGRHMTRGGG